MNILDYIKHNQEKAVFLSNELQIVYNRDEKWLKLYENMVEAIENYEKALAYLFRVMKKFHKNCFKYYTHVEISKLISFAIRKLLFCYKNRLKILNRLSLSALHNLLKLHHNYTVDHIIPFTNTQLSKEILIKLNTKFQL